MSDKIYIIGHKNPDLDSVAAAYAMATCKNAIENTDIYTPVIVDEINKETAFALEKFNFALPGKIEEIMGAKLILVDHNEFSQAIDGVEQAIILEIVDHHKIDFKYHEPIIVTTRPWGSCCTMVYQLFMKGKMNIDKNLAGLMLSAILVDTVITKSPTCLDIDRETIIELSAIAGIDDWQKFGMDIFKVRSSVSEMPVEAIIKSDFKDFIFKAGTFGIGQVETVDLEEYSSREEEILADLKNLKEQESYHTTILFITDIIKEGSKFFVVSDDIAGVEKAMNAKFVDQRAYLPGIMSRKKQVMPEMMDMFDK